MRSTKSGLASSESQANSRSAEKSQENFGISALTRCLVDADGNAAVGAGRARRKALGVSALIQFCTLTALLIVPLFATGSRLILRPTNFVPLPPYGGAPKPTPASTPRQSPPPTTNNRAPRFEAPQVQAPTHIPTKISLSDDADPKIGTTSTPNSDAVPGSGGPIGLQNLIPGIPGPSSPQPPRPDIATVPPPRKAITVSQGVQLALLTHRVEPIYPSFARQAHREGTVELRAIISTDGVVKDVQILSGDSVLAQAARDAVTQWRFRPTLLNGVAVEVITFVTVKFHIDQ